MDVVPLETYEGTHVVEPGCILQELVHGIVFGKQPYLGELAAELPCITHDSLLVGGIASASDRQVPDRIGTGAEIGTSVLEEVIGLHPLPQSGTAHRQTVDAEKVHQFLHDDPSADDDIRTAGTYLRDACTLLGCHGAELPHQGLQLGAGDVRGVPVPAFGGTRLGDGLHGPGGTDRLVESQLLYRRHRTVALGVHQPLQGFVLFRGHLPGLVHPGPVGHADRTETQTVKIQILLPVGQGEFCTASSDVYAERASGTVGTEDAETYQSRLLPAGYDLQFHPGLAGRLHQFLTVGGLPGRTGRHRYGLGGTVLFGDDRELLQDECRFGYGLAV